MIAPRSVSPIVWRSRASRLGRFRSLHQREDPALPQDHVRVGGVLQLAGQPAPHAAMPRRRRAGQALAGRALLEEPRTLRHPGRTRHSPAVEPDRGERPVPLERMRVALPELAKLPRAVAVQRAVERGRERTFDLEGFEAVLARQVARPQEVGEIGRQRNGIDACCDHVNTVNIRCLTRKRKSEQCKHRCRSTRITTAI